MLLMSQTNDSRPLVSVVTAAYNRDSFLPETIHSILSQSYPNIEYIVLDDGSTDDTREVLARYDARIRWESHPNMGESLTVNKGWSMARGELVVTVSSDDPVLPGLIESGAEFMLAHPQVLVAYPDWLMIDSKGKVLQEVKTNEYNYLNMIRWNRCYPGPGTFIRKKCFALAGMRDPAYRLIGDFEFWMRLGLHGPFARIPHTLATWRQHPDAATVTGRGQALAKEHVRLMEEFFARNDLPPQVRALKAEATAVAYFMAGDACFARDYAQTQRYWRRCLRLAASCRMRLYPGGEPIHWREMLPRILLPEWLYGPLRSCRRYLHDAHSEKPLAVSR
jgi:glycosyltransferase involved in cell wall biosynthesis